MNFDFRLPEKDAVLAAIRSCHPKRLLDVGTGRGVIAMEAASIASLVATERFEQPISEARRQCPASVHLIQASPCSLPFAAGYFDVVLCTQLLDHLEESEKRKNALAEMARVLRPEGKIVITVLHQNFRFNNFNIPKVGTSEGVFYHRYYVDEFRQLLETHYHIDSLQGVWTYLPKTYPLYTRLGSCVVYWERLVRRSSLSLRYGKMLLAVCRPKALCA